MKITRIPPPIAMPRPSLAPERPSWVEQRHEDLKHLSGLVILNENESFYRELLSGAPKATKALERFGTLKNLQAARDETKERVIPLDSLLPTSDEMKKWAFGAFLASAGYLGGLFLGVQSGYLGVNEVTTTGIYVGGAVMAGLTSLTLGGLTASGGKILWDNWVARREYVKLNESWVHLRALITKDKVQNWLDLHPESELEVMEQTHRRLIEEQGRWKIALGRLESEIQKIYESVAFIPHLHPANRASAREDLEQRYEVLDRRRLECRKVISEFDCEIDRLKAQTRQVLIKRQLKKPV